MKPPAAQAIARSVPEPLDPLPPLVDREVLFGDPEIGFGALSPDGRFISFAKPLDGVMNVWVKGLTEPWSAARPVTADRVRPLIHYFWSRDGSRILFAQDQGGDENFRVYAVDPAAPPAADSPAPPARDLTPFEGVQAQIIAVPEDTPDHILIGLNDRDARLHDVHRLNIRTGQRELVFRNEHEVAGWVADLEGRLRLGVRMTPTGGTELLRVDGEQLVPVYTCTAEETCTPVRFHRDAKRVYVETDRGEPDLARLVLLDPESGEEELVESDPEDEVDFGGAIFSRATDELLATSYTGDRGRIYPKDDQFATDLALIRRELPDGDLAFRSATNDDRLWMVKLVLDTDEGPNHLYDRASGAVELLYRPRPDLPAEHLAPMKSVRYTARDGVELRAYLTLPKGVEPRALPAVVVPHGGPWARDNWGFNPIAQLLANRGYAVLMPNFRGSTGFGKRFLNLGNKQWGTGAMQHDISDGVGWLIDQGTADAARIGILGRSYGGYATLAGLTFTPELYAAGVAIVGPSSILTLIRSIPPYWEPLKQVFTVRVGDIDDPDEQEMLRSRSPLHSADRIRAPLLVIQGANDPRVKKPESDQIVAAAHEHGVPVEYLVAPDEGHAFAGHINKLAMWAAVEQFLAEHLGGRYQPEMPDEVRERLDALRVDVETVGTAPA